jgi:hypothetical protein
MARRRICVRRSVGGSFILGLRLLLLGLGGENVINSGPAGDVGSAAQLSPATKLETRASSSRQSPTRHQQTRADRNARAADAGPSYPSDVADVR